MTHLSEETALASLGVIQDYLPADFDTLGITEEEFELISSGTPWRRDYISRIVRTMNGLIHGALEVMALPKIIVPAEYVAAVIAATVHPSNAMACCVILAQERATGVGALELAARSAQVSSIDPTSADQLFALVCVLNNKSKANSARQALRKRLGLKIDQALKGTMQ